MSDDLAGIRTAYQAWIEQLEAGGRTRRRERLDRLAGPADVRAWAEETRAWWRQAVGPLPLAERPQAPVLCGRIERDGYRIEKWLIETLPGTWNATNLYLPGRINPQGLAICAPVGHWVEGKALKDYQRLGAFMALHGIPVLVLDYPGNGERREYVNPVSGISATGKSPSDEHYHAGALALLAGIPPCRPFIAEDARAFEFLAAIPGVDRRRIGFTGVSGGGTMSCLAGAYLEETAFSIPVCIIGDEDVSSTGDAEQLRPQSGLRGCAAIDLLAALVPRPVMVVRETGFAATARSVATLQRIYALAGAPPQATAYFPVDDVHGYTHVMIEAVYGFLAANFGLAPLDFSVWTRIRTLPAEQLWCMPSGVLLRDRPQVLLQEQIARLAPAPAGLDAARLAALLGIADLPRSPVPAFLPGELGERAVVTGMSTAKPGEVGLLDWVEQPPEYWGPTQAAIYRSEAAGESWRLSCFGHSLLGLRVRQILDAVARGTCRELSASGEWSVPLAIACALAPARLLPRAVVRDLPAGLRTVLTARLNAIPVQCFVPGLLAAGDMAGIVALCGDRLQVENWRDAEGRAVPGPLLSQER